MLENEKELVVKSRNGDSQAFGVLYDHYVRRIYNFIFYKTYHKETAEDLSSQTFFKALNSIASVDPERSFSSWIYKIAQNTVIDHYRKDRNHADIDDIWDISDDTDILSDLDVDRNFKNAQKYLKELPQLERDIIMMRVWQEMPYKEIAEIVGKSEANCKMIYSRAIKKLRDVVPLAVLVLLMLKM